MNIPECDNVRPITAEYGVVHGELNVETGTLTFQSQKPRTNGDRLRALTDEELAKMINGFESFALNCGGAWPVENWLEWLKQEADK